VNTLRTVLQSLDTETLEDAFRRHAKTLLPEGEVGDQPDPMGQPRGRQTAHRPDHILDGPNP
jgi:hypothetical protein